jgi:transglutaminase-like putative cysteine protease
MKSLMVAICLLAGLLPAPSGRASSLGDVATAFPTGDYPTGLAWDGTRLWLADRDRSRLYAIEPASGAVVDSLECPSFSPVGLAWGDGCIWVSGYYEPAIYKLEMKTRKVVDVISAPGELTTGLAWEDGYLWACNATAREIAKLDPLDGTTIETIKAPSKYSDGLAFDGKYLWVSDRRQDKIYSVVPETGIVVLALDSPGPYPRGLTWTGDALWVVDYQQDSLYSLVTDGDETWKTEEPKDVRIRFTVKVRCQGPDPVERCDIYAAVPHTDLKHQDLLEDVTFSPAPEEFIADKWSQEFAHFVLTDIEPGQTRRVTYETAARISKMHMSIIPEKVGSLRRIPDDIRRAYTVDGERLLIDDPVIQSAVKEAVGDETNPYWIMRKIFEYVIDHVDFERVGGWDTAPNVLKRGTGSCSEFSFVFMAMARAAGLPTRFCAGVVERGDEASMDDVFHRWTEVYLPGYGWVPVDASATESEWQSDRIKWIGSYSNRILVTTTGGGDSEYVGWGYNYGFKYSYGGRTSIDRAAYADWEPLE